MSKPEITTLASWTLLIAFVIVFVGCSSGPRTVAEMRPPELGVTHGTLPELSAKVPGADEISAEIRSILDAQVADWNNGNIRGFMNGYTRQDTLIFISNGTMRSGWQNSLYAYMRNYPDRASMGTLSFEDLHVQVLSTNTALVIGRYRLVRADDEPLGLFSLVFKKQNNGWRIIHDHTSSSP